MISRIIARQTQRRDLVIWSFGLRNELPLTNDYTKGLALLNLSNNQFSDLAADIITNSLSYDQYIRSIDFSGNLFSKESCKKFIRMLRKNTAILNFDLKDNPGYDPEIHARMVMKMSKNIQYLNQQVVNNQFTIEEFNQLKQFINLSFFNVDIPDEIVDMYNNQVSSSQSQQISTLGNKAKGKALAQGVINEEEKSSFNKNDNHKGVQLEDEEYENESSMNHKTDMSEIKAQNKQLTAENIRLKRELIEVRASKIQNSIIEKKKESQGVISPQIDSNYNRIVDLLSELTDLMNNVESSLIKADNKKKEHQPAKKIIVDQNDEIIGEESEEREQASSRKPEPVSHPKEKIAPIAPAAQKPPEKAVEPIKQVLPEKKEPVKPQKPKDEELTEEDLHYRGREEEEEEEEEGEEYLDEEDIRQNIYQNPYARQYMMDEDDEEEMEEDDLQPMNRKINKSF